MKHICFYYYHINIIGGVEIAILNLISRLHTKYKITVAFDKDNSSLDFLLRLSKYADIVNISKERLECDTLVICSLYGSYRNIKAKKKIRWLHANLKEIKYKLDREQDIEDYVVVSEECGKQLQESNGADYKLIYNLLDKDILDKANEEVDVVDKPLKLVTVARISPEKGFERMLKFANILKQRKIDYVWYVIGKGNDDFNKGYEDNIKKRSPKQFIYLGKLDNPFPYMKQCDFLVQLSNYESQGLVVVEALTIGTPVIITNYKVATETVDDKVNGYIVDMELTNVPELKPLKFKYEYKTNIEEWEKIL